MSSDERSFEIERLSKFTDKELERELRYNKRLLKTKEQEHPFFREKLELYVTERIDIINTLLNKGS